MEWHHRHTWCSQRLPGCHWCRWWCCWCLSHGCSHPRQLNQRSSFKFCQKTINSYVEFHLYMPGLPGENILVFHHGSEVLQLCNLLLSSILNFWRILPDRSIGNVKEAAENSKQDNWLHFEFGEIFGQLIQFNKLYRFILILRKSKRRMEYSQYKVNFYVLIHQ